MSNDANSWIQTGCNCSNSCKGGMNVGDECMYFIARSRGPISFQVCSVDGGKTYHDKDGWCLHCEYESKRKGMENEQLRLHSNHLVGVPKQSET